MDLLIKLYNLPATESSVTRLRAQAIHLRRAMAYEKNDVVAWVAREFGLAWASECDVSFANRPLSCFLATQSGNILGFACYDATCRGFFGPVGVTVPVRGRGIGAGLLQSCLHAMAEQGYGYAIVGGTSAPEFYAKHVWVLEIPDSVPGVYRDRLGT